jgi:hypothetical protein
MHIRYLQRQRLHQFNKVVPLRFDSHDGLDLTCRDQQTRCGDKARYDRMAQKVRKKAQTQHAHHQQHGARQESQRDRDVPVALRARHRMFANGRSGHE